MSDLATPVVATLLATVLNSNTLEVALFIRRTPPSGVLAPFPVTNVLVMLNEPSEMLMPPPVLSMILLAAMLTAHVVASTPKPVLLSMVTPMSVIDGAPDTGAAQRMPSPLLPPPPL